MSDRLDQCGRDILEGSVILTCLSFHKWIALDWSFMAYDSISAAEDKRMQNTDHHGVSHSCRLTLHLSFLLSPLDLNAFFEDACWLFTGLDRRQLSCNFESDRNACRPPRMEFGTNERDG